MLHVLICEDDPKHRARIEEIVRSHIAAEASDMKLALSADGPMAILDYVKAQADNKNLYLLDVTLGHEIDGIALAVKIRELDGGAKIVFITTRAELSHLVFTHKLEALDYIVKDQPEAMETRVRECLQVAYARYLDEKTSKRKYFPVRVGGQVWNVPYGDILFFETHLAVRNKIVLHMADSQLEFRGSISEIADIGSSFFRCHKSFVVNTKNIKYVDRSKREIEMKNGELVPVTPRKMVSLLESINR